MSLDPIKTTRAIAEKYRSYLSTTFWLKEPSLQEQFLDELQPEKYVKGPILEATPSFRPGLSLLDLIQEGVLSAEFKRLRSTVLPLERPLYRHQELAVRKIVQEDRNVVVATGTGSGKTESFIVPVLDHLFRQKEQSALGPGVRAILLYPMNALANDQLKRMRALLKNYPDITFGRYTGETEKRQGPAAAKYRQVYHEEPLPNELVSREAMKENPPHFLLTNYAMLEYLLLRPEDHVFFDGGLARDWRFIVIDEAHTYYGAKGIETALLIRRLKERISGNINRPIRCIATSATLGEGQDGEIAGFGSNIFGEPFDRDDVIRGLRMPVLNSAPFWGRPSLSLYEKWVEILDKFRGADAVRKFLEAGKGRNVPAGILRTAREKARSDPRRFLFNVLQGDARLLALKKSLEERPRLLAEAAHEVFKDGADSLNSALVALVDLASRAREEENDQPLLPARYHLFVKAIEGAYISLRPNRKLFLERRERLRDEGREFMVFELAACRQCGSAYLVGEEKPEENGDFLRQAGSGVFENMRAMNYYLLLDPGTRLLQEDEDEAVNLDNSEKACGDRYRVCGACGAIGRIGALSPLCNCGEENYCEVLKIKAKDGKVHRCPACARTNPKGSMVWRFLLGKDAVASVLATSLYQQVPAARQDTGKAGSALSSAHDEWSSTLSHDNPAEQPDTLENVGRRLLIFSDSRQGAAFFAPYLNRTYLQILRRRLILKTIDENRAEVLRNQWRVQDVIFPLVRTIDRLGLVPDGSAQEEENEAWKWMLHELLCFDPRLGLEGLGCLGFSLVKPEAWRPPEPFLKGPWNLDEDEVWMLFRVLLDSFRKNRAVLFPDNVSPGDEFFKPVNYEYFFRENGSSRQRHIMSWCPSSENHTNTRLDFLMRLGQALGEDIPRATCLETLRNIWAGSLTPGDPASCWQSYFHGSSLRGEGTVYRFKHNYWRLQPAAIDRRVNWYHCRKCNRLTLLNVRDVCPTYQCEGKLQRCEPAQEFAENHYRKLYLEVIPLKMRAEEHTAQLVSQTAAALQERFIEGEINVLSCSTTFELGVDVGELESVFMRNVPPTAANYTQRAGRAGRRAEATAFALTFCTRRSHDLTYFQNPEKMVSGLIQPPRFEIKNEKIIRRHVYATALARFWKHHRAAFWASRGRMDVESFFFGHQGPTLFKEYLDEKPPELLEALKKIVPENMYQVVGLDSWEWVSGLFDAKAGVLARAVDELQSDVTALEKARQDFIARHLRSDHILHAIKTIKGRYLINYLSSRNVIPKYGFPVDVVELQIQYPSSDRENLELNRDLKIALSEYAPSSQVVAGGKLWTSRYIKKLAQREWPRYRYAICDYCHNYQRVLADSDEKLEDCEVCHYPLEGRDQGTFIIPEFGFITSTEKPATPGEEQPERTYSTRTFFSGTSDEEDELTVNFDRHQVQAVPATRGRMAVLNHAGYQGFKICSFCGYTRLGNEQVKTPHKTPWGTGCNGKLVRYSLGHEFLTDILHIRLDSYSNLDRGFWLSILYALLEGTSESLDIERQDLDGCLYSFSGDPASPAIVLFDDVPGGAGHVRRVAGTESSLKSVFQTTYERVSACTCGGEDMASSCYGCLRNYRNQYCHEMLNRSKVVRFFEDELGFGHKQKEMVAPDNP